MRLILSLLLLVNICRADDRYFWWYGTSYDTFDADRIELIEYNESAQNMLFRGDIPRKNKNSYDRGGLIRGIKKYFREYCRKNSAYKKHKFPKRYQLVVISMMTPETEQEIDFLKIIYGYYSKQKTTELSLRDIPYQKAYDGRNKDVWLWWWVRANFTNTPPFSDNVSFRELEKTLDLSDEAVKRKLINQTWDGYSLDFPELIERLTSFMTERNDTPTIIYIHSRHGINRTASTHAAYLMRRFGYSIEEAWKAAQIEDKKKQLEIHKPSEAKTFLMYYSRYLSL